MRTTRTENFSIREDIWRMERKNLYLARPRMSNEVITNQLRMVTVQCEARANNLRIAHVLCESFTNCSRTRRIIYGFWRTISESITDVANHLRLS